MTGELENDVEFVNGHGKVKRGISSSKCKAGIVCVGACVV